MSSTLPPLSLYIHIPWCVQKCPYCDFNSHQLRGEIPAQDYVHHLLADLEHDLPHSQQRPLTSIFIGGGTPSLLPDNALRQLLDGVRQRLPLIRHAEITLEANPGTVEAQRFAGYQHAGVNRISIGVQSFHPPHLRRLGRIHNAEEAIHAAQLARQLNLHSVNLDLMHGLPEQTPHQALQDLRQAIALQPPHLSWYQLTIEPHTQFASRPPPLPDEDTLWHIDCQGKALLSAAGYQHYETSAYGKPGHRCQHNLNYWRFGDYLGIGCGAHGKITRPDGQILRTVKTRHPRGYLQGHYQHSQHQVADADKAFEYFMNRFRLFEKIPREEITRLTGITEHQLRDKLDQALAQNYIHETTHHWQITEHGARFLNFLLELFL